MLKKITLILSIFLFSCSASFSEQVAIIDLDFLLTNSNKGKLILENLKKLDEKNIKELKLKSDKLSELENEIKNKKNIISNEAYNKEIKDFTEKVALYRKEKDILVKNFNDFKDNELHDFFKKISPIIKNYMDKNSIHILFDKKNIFMGNNNIDVTSQILQEVNKSIN